MFNQYDWLTGEGLGDPTVRPMMTLPADCDETVELGLPDGPLDTIEEKDPFTSKIGGKPSLLFDSALIKDKAICSQCRSPLYLLLQMDCPDTPGIDRVIYLFACNTRECTESGFSGVAAALVQCKPANKSSQKSDKPHPSTDGLWGFLTGANASDQGEIDKRLSELSLLEDQTTGVHLETFPTCFPAIRMHIVNELINIKSKLVKHLDETNMGFDNNTEESSWQGETYESMQMLGYDKVFKNFHTRVSYYPRQLVRYSPYGVPLLFSADPLPDIKACAHCGQSRHFDLQVMPAILSKLPINDPKYLKHIPESRRNMHPLYGDGMEWGTIIVYTCGTCTATITDPDEYGGKEFLGQVVIQIEKDLIMN